MNDGWQTMFISRTKFMALFTITITSSLITIGALTSSAFADTQKSTSQSYLLLPITAGGQRENPGYDDGPPPALLHKDRSSSLMSHSDDSMMTTLRQQYHVMTSPTISEIRIGLQLTITPYPGSK